ncbi:MAG: phosphatase PAP2 family protein, partial [Pseudomonadota bacterium]|nr:phosphatase PAP2 family protein [Pseudomonadota bacterium]
MTSPRSRPFWTHMPSRRETAKVVALALVLGVVTGVVFSAWPELDIAVSRLFSSGEGRFPMTRSWFWQILREVFLKGFTLWYVFITVACFATYRHREAVLGLQFRKWLYLAICSLTGPLLLVNVVLKEHWGRWRPREVIPLGGDELHTAPLDWGGSCLDNCSFVSGEVSSTVMVFIALAFISTAWRPIFYALALVLGGVSTLIRVGQGGHFLSDALFSGILMTLVAAGLYWAMFLRERPAADTRPV